MQHLANVMCCSSRLISSFVVFPVTSRKKFSTERFWQRRRPLMRRSHALLIGIDSIRSWGGSNRPGGFYLGTICVTFISLLWSLRLAIRIGLGLGLGFSSRCRSDLEQSSAARHIRSVTSRLLHPLEDILLQTVLFMKRLSCLRSDIVILDTLIVLLTYLLTFLLQPMPTSCHFRGCKVPLSRIVSGAISSELALSLQDTDDYQTDGWLQNRWPYCCPDRMSKHYSNQLA